jgi:hypothetical protein
VKVKGVGSMLPKAIWVDLYEELVVKNQHHKLSRNVSIVYYKRLDIHFSLSLMIIYKIKNIPEEEE